MIRLAVPEDYPEILRMAKDFHKVSPYSSLPLYTPGLRKVFDQYLGSDKTEVIVIVAEDQGELFGLLVGTAMTPFLGRGLATELAWWVDPEKRNRREALQLWQAFEVWAKKVGAKIVEMGHLESSVDLSRVYEKRGYRPGEALFVKEV